MWQNGCQRDFQSLASFRQHILSEHLIQLDYATSNDYKPALITVTHDQPEAQDEVMLIEEDSEDSDLKNGDVFVDDYSIDAMFDNNGIVLPTISFVAKLKSYPSIPMSAVNDIVHDVQVFFSSAIVNMLKHRTISLLQSENLNIDNENV